MEHSIFQSLEIIENRISEKLTVENIANSVHFSKYHYQRLFREIVGDSVMAYITKRKLTLAGKALLETQMPILDIALEFGFDSHEGFTRSFKSYMGITPSNYRKYHLTAISQKTAKGKLIMMYSKITDEIIRELNDFVVKAKETAILARQNNIPKYTPFWHLIADTTDKLADQVKNVLERITNIAEHPDEITNRFAIIKVFEDISFQSNLLAFNVGLTISRGHPKDNEFSWPLCEKFYELAGVTSLKVGKVSQFLGELSTLIFKDIREAATDRINDVVQKGKVATDDITGYNNIKAEINNLVQRLAETPINEVTVSSLNEYLFQLNIISFTVELDITQNPQDKASFDGLFKLKDSLQEAIEFFLSLPVVASECNHGSQKFFQDVAFQGNILLFYTRGEIEKLADILNTNQKATFDEICNKINKSIKIAQQATDMSAQKEIPSILYEINTNMIEEANKLKERGGSIAFIATEVKNLADRTAKVCTH